ncbi:MAG: hypothetical protein P4L40_01455 [Terracidiphilus sp.]|nr:hypothetical protein [Terracidiphilus sp.]
MRVCVCVRCVCVRVCVCVCANSPAGPRFYEEMSDRSILRFTKATCWAMGLVMVLYASTAVLGYVAFGNQVEGDVLKSFPGE